MRIPQIQISKTDIQMQYKITEPKQRISQPHADLSISQPAAILEISTTNPKMHIDNSQLWRDLGLKPTSDLIRDYAQQGRQGVLKGISKTMSEGRQMMLNAGKGQKGQALQEIAKQNSELKVSRIGLDFIPSYNAVKVNIQPGTTDVEITQQKPKIDVKVNKPIHDYTPGDVNGTMVVRPDVKVDVIG